MQIPSPTTDPKGARSDRMDINKPKDELAKKREKIREGLGELLAVSTDDHYQTIEGGSLHFIVGRLLNYLDSQGCVLKVERELPDEGMGTYEATRGAQIMYQNLIKLGYVAVEPLIDG